MQARLACSGGLCGGKIGDGLKQIARGGPSRQAQLSKGPGHLSLSQGVEVGVGNIKAKTIRVLGFRKLTFSMEWWFNSFSVTLYMTMG